MKELHLVVFGIIMIFSQSCKKKEVPTQIVAPKEIAVVSGNDQYGYPGDTLYDSIVIKISAYNSEDLQHYSYYFKTSDDGALTLKRLNQIVGDLYVSADWKLSSKPTQQELKFYLTERCAQKELTSECKIIDSLSIRAFIKDPWKKVFAGGSYMLYDIYFSDETDGIAVGDLPYNTGYLKTNDGGNTWNIVSNIRHDLFQLSFSDKDTGIVIVTNNYAYFTDNGGKSFYMGDWVPPIVGDFSSSDYLMQTAKTIFTVGRYGSIAKSIDRGKSWKTYNGFSYLNWLRSIACPSNEVCFACGEMGKVVKTLNGGETWSEQEVLNTNNLKKIYFLDENFGFAGGENGALIRTIDGGKTWETILSKLKFTIIGICFLSRDIGYIISESGEIGKTIDGGLTWSVINKNNYGVDELKKVIIKDKTIWGLQYGSIFTYELE
jgi:photosystem II stability/assembly factor-like uncharacterized protein